MTYRKMLRERLPKFNIMLFNYCITSNHVHLLLRPDPSEALESLSRFMQSLEGDFSQFYNRRKNRLNAFWGDRYHATMIEFGEHLWKCLLYIDLNMVRAGVMDHPREWEWTGYQELMGLRKRYCLVDRVKLLEHLGAGSEESFRKNFTHGIGEAIARNEMVRDAKWTENLAVGSEPFVKKVGLGIRNRMKVKLNKDEKDRSTWIVRESGLPNTYS